MATSLHHSPIYGPVNSRRLGLSLGINLMPADGKYCTFDCIYCECGSNSERHTISPRPTRSKIVRALENKLCGMSSEGVLPDVLTFAGNGEPTAHPDFSGIIADTIALRNRLCPKARIAVLSNATMITRKDVFDALMTVDDNILKLDTADAIYINKVCRPAVPLTDTYGLISRMAEFGGHVTIQTMFMKGQVDGFDVDNTTEGYVSQWLEALKVIKPEKVMIYTIDRDTPVASLKKADRYILENIRRRAEALGMECIAGY